MLMILTILAASAVAPPTPLVAAYDTLTIKEAALTLYDLPTQEAFAREAILGQRTFTSDRAKDALAGFARRGSATR